MGCDVPINAQSGNHGAEFFDGFAEREVEGGLKVGTAGCDEDGDGIVGVGSAVEAAGGDVLAGEERASRAAFAGEPSSQAGRLWLAAIKAGRMSSLTVMVGGGGSRMEWL